jgi:hypothetical protein
MCQKIVVVTVSASAVLLVIASALANPGKQLSDLHLIEVVICVLCSYFSNVKASVTVASRMLPNNSNLSLSFLVSLFAISQLTMIETVLFAILAGLFKNIQYRSNKSVFVFNFGTSVIVTLLTRLCFDVNAYSTSSVVFIAIQTIASALVYHFISVILLAAVQSASSGSRFLTILKDLYSLFLGTLLALPSSPPSASDYTCPEAATRSYCHSW